MNKKLTRIIMLIILTPVLNSCNKYLDVQPKGVQILKTVDDFDQWLNSPYLEASVPDSYCYLEDDDDMPAITNPPTNLIYIWADQFSSDLSSSPAFLSDHYRSVYYFNTVLATIDKVSGGDSKKKSLKAEALLGRALEYLYLVNLYGKVYNEKTSATDLAVPFVTSNDLATPTPPRSTVKEIYNNIITDLNAALPDLPGDNSQNRYRGSTAAAYSVFARTYFYMGNYQQAATYANLALQNGPNTVIDYNSISNSGALGILATRADAIYARTGENSQVRAYSPTLSYLQSFDKTDLRLKLYYNINNNSFNIRGTTLYYGMGTTGSNGVGNWGTSVTEMRLIIAEAAARTGDLNTALAQLDLVRKCRFPKATYQAFQSTDQQQILTKILTERTFEFAFLGMRWFDMRRLDAENKMPAVNRYDGSNKIIATLEPHSPRYTLQIPAQALYYNPGMPQNP